jgi:hypothetical protein
MDVDIATCADAGFATAMFKRTTLKLRRATDCKRPDCQARRETTAGVLGLSESEFGLHSQSPFVRKIRLL